MRHLQKSLIISKQNMLWIFGLFWGKIVVAMKEKVILVSVAVVFKADGDKINWFVIKQSEDGGWEFPKTVVRRVESSVRASIRNMAEQGAMNAKVWEEVGRAGGATKVNGRPVAQRFIYYLMEYKGAGIEVLGFANSDWVDFSKAQKILGTKRDVSMLRTAREMYKDMDKRGVWDVVEEEEVEIPAEA